MREGPWGTLISDLCNLGVPGLSSVTRVMPSLSLKQRKAIVSICRSQSFPRDDTTFGRLALESSLPNEFINDEDLVLLYESPITSNLLIELCLCTPMTNQMVADIKADMVRKEIRVMESTPLPSSLHYPTWFDHTRHHIPLHPHLPANPNTANLIRNRLDIWKQNCTSRIHYPRMSTKTVSKDTARLLHSEYSHIWQGMADEDIVSHVTLEEHYHRTGQKVGGVCEMRQRWYTAGLVPRTYYASGGEAYWLSRHLQWMFNDLVDSLAITNRYSRVNPSRLRLREGYSAVIYDLSSFSSNCHEQRHFLNALAEDCLGTKVIVVDAWFGAIEQDLGEMIYAYNALNTNPEYSIERIWHSMVDVMLVHSVAGFLGVFGNIATCTYLHGCVALSVCSTEDEGNVAGDDGLLPTKGDMIDALAAPLLLGVLALEKCGKTTELNAVHLKRPITQVDNRLVPGRMVIWPSLELIYSDMNQCDPRFPYLADETIWSRRHSTASSCARFLRHLSTFPSIDHWELELVVSFLTTIYRRLDLPLCGSVPQCGGDQRTGFVAAVSREAIGIDPVKFTIPRLYTGSAFLPYRGRIGVVQDIEWVGGIIFESNSSPKLRYLSDLGYLARDETKILYVGERGLDMLLKEWCERPDPAIYTYEVIMNVPTHLVALE
jgi:hypothetical protein